MVPYNIVCYHVMRYLDGVVQDSIVLYCISEESVCAARCCIIIVLVKYIHKTIQYNTVQSNTVQDKTGQGRARQATPDYSTLHYYTTE